MLLTEPIYQLALGRVPSIGNVLAKTLAEHFETAEAIFKASLKQLCQVDGISEVKAGNIRSFKDFEACQTEYSFLQKHSIRLLFVKDPDYPQRLLNCYDPPTILYYKGSANLNGGRIISIIGTRHLTDYGKQVTEQLVEGLSTHGVTIASGMAFGIDTQAHRACVRFSVPTIGVLAHGLDTIYPAENAKLAKQMLEQQGGLLSEFPIGTKPDRHNFPTRNRVVAGLCDATVVVETDVKGGSMITAELALGYNRDVFAVPGRSSDAKSRGCNTLIKRNKAALITNAEDLLEAMNWLPAAEKKPHVQRSLFIELTPAERTIVDLLNQKGHLHIDELNLKSGLNASAAAGALLSLELQGVVQAMPGKVYKII